MRRAWNNWFHIMFSTYGQWLPGDNRGWRTRHHRDHIEGDYRHPVPSNRRDGLYGASRLSMKGPALLVPPQDRPIIGHLALESLSIMDVEVLAPAVTVGHVHMLARCDKRAPREVGRAVKRHVTTHLGRYLRWIHRREPPAVCENPAVAPECAWRGERDRRLWAKRGREKPVRDRGHQLRVFGYILDHQEENAWVWDFRKGPLAYAPRR